jgi:hypothetical protein
MLPPLYTTLQSSADVRALMGPRPRLFRQGEAPQKEDKPYGVWLVVSGVPENTLSETPTIDRCSIQIDLYATTDDQSEALAIAVRDCLEPYAHMTAWRVVGREPETRLFRISVDFDWWNPRPA